MAATHPRLEVPRASTPTGRASTPVRRTLQRLLAPMMSPFVTAHYELAGAQEQCNARAGETDARLDALTAEVAALHAWLAAHVEATQDEVNAARRRLIETDGQLADAHLRIDRLTDEVAAANALAWDQVALARRLGTIEDRLGAQA